MKSLHNNNSPEKGFSLIECLVAMVITTIGLLAVAGLIGVGIRLQTESRDATAATAFARAKIEQLENFAPTAAERAAGGSITANVANYNDTPDPKYRRRWLIETNATNAAVPVGTQRITISMTANQLGVRLPAVRLSVLVPAQ
jgi:prepilin-type N-terminal cleavage/methylation domain-containing protein